MTGAAGRADAAYLLDSSGPAAPPRSNGELQFAAPWESRAFGVALALHDAGRIEWEDFRQALISEIGAWEAAHPSGEGWSYYQCWLGALERVVDGQGLVGDEDLRARASALAARPEGHDHRHDEPALAAPPGGPGEGHSATGHSATGHSATRHSAAGHA